MKKFLSLVLALVMALSLTTAAWGADVTVTVGTSGDYSSLQDAINAAATGNTTTIKLLEDVSGNVTISQKENVNIVIDGDDNEFTGTFYIHGNARFEGAETLTFQNINFTTTTKLDFISSDSTGSVERYAHNVTVKDCTFTATDAGVDKAVGMRFRAGYDISVINCEATGLHSVMQAVGCTGIIVDNLTTADCKSGLSVGTSQQVSVANSTINTTGADGYGIRAGGNANDAGVADLAVENCTVKAFIPVLVRNVVNEGNELTMSGTNTLTATNDDGYAVALSQGDYDDSTALVQPDVPYALNNTGNAVQTSQVGFVVNGTTYAKLSDAIAAASGGDTVVMMADSTEIITVNKAITIDPNGYALTGMTADTNYQVVTNTAGEYVVTAAVTFGDKYDLYLADSNMNTMLKLKAPTVAGLSFTEVAAKTNKDGSGNVAYIAANNGQYFVKTTSPTVADYAVTDAGKTTVLYYVTVAGTSAANFAYEESVSAFTNFSTYDKCGYVTGTPVAGKTYFQDSLGNVFMAGTAGTGPNYLLNGKVVSGTYVGTPETHTFVFNGYQYDATLKTNVPTSALCTKCMMTTSSIYLYNKVPATYTIYETTGEGHNDYTVALPSASAVVPSTGTTTDKVVESAETFDAGIAMYVGMSVMAAAGSAVVLKKKED